jgi:hypothetical protein
MRIAAPQARDDSHLASVKCVEDIPAVCADPVWLGWA